MSKIESFLRVSLFSFSSFFFFSSLFSIDTFERYCSIPLSPCRRRWSIYPFTPEHIHSFLSFHIGNDQPLFFFFFFFALLALFLFVSLSTKEHTHTYTSSSKMHCSSSSRSVKIITLIITIIDILSPHRSCFRCSLIRCVR